MIRGLLLIVYIVLLFLNRRKTLKISWIVLAIAVGIGLVIWGISAIIERRESVRENNIEVSLEYKPTSCEEGYPILVSIYNGSSRTITKSLLYIGIYKPWFSDDIIETFRSIESDKIIYPWENYAFCWKMPPLREYSLNFSQLVYKVNMKSITFQ